MSSRDTKFLDKATRREIAEEVWRVFALISSNTALAFDQNGVTIRVALKEKHEIPEGCPFIYGNIRNLRDYKENP
jgi:hypothetical protein